MNVGRKQGSPPIHSSARNILVSNKTITPCVTPLRNPA